MKFAYIIFLVPIFFASCRDCEDDSEPILGIHFDNMSSYDLFYGFGGTDTLNMTAELPIAINRDSSVYIFISSEKTDTLGISYKRHIKYDSDICGFSITLDSFSLLDISTFDSAEFIIHDITPTIFGESGKNAYYVILYH